MLDTRSRSLTLLVATLAILLASCGTGDESPDVASLASEGASETETAPGTVPTEGVRDDALAGEVAAEDQTSDGTEVTVAGATLDDARGWVVIHRDESGAPGEVLGYAQLPAESSAGPLTVTLDTPLEPGDHPLWAMLHVDADPVGTYGFPGEDVPVTVDDAVVMAPFTVTVTG